MVEFVQIVAEAGCDRFSVHARKAWLQGLSPKENRDIPPLRYEDVYRLKQEFPHLFIEINGGIQTLEQVQEHLCHLDAVMIGRAAYDNPYLFATIDQAIYGEDKRPLTRQEIAEAMLPYIERWVSQGGKLHTITRHMLQLFAGEPGTRAWKRYLTEQSSVLGAGTEVIQAALQHQTEVLNLR
jgi:tRNA-dihydrouridine synthase A